MRITFKNGENDDKNIRETAINVFNSIAEDFERFRDIQDDETQEEFCNYGLCFDFVPCDNDEQTEAYYRYQLAWGGPSYEFRIYEDDTLEFVYLDWFCGIGHDVSNEDSVNWIVDYFKDIAMIDFESQDFEDRFLLEEEEEDDSF